jgi:hypothetical protein
MADYKMFAWKERDHKIDLAIADAKQASEALRQYSNSHPEEMTRMGADQNGDGLVPQEYYDLVICLEHRTNRLLELFAEDREANDGLKVTLPEPRVGKK